MGYANSTPCFTFRCGIDNKVNDIHKSSIVGLTRSPLSLSSQLRLNIFAYCISRRYEAPRTKTMELEKESPMDIYFLVI